jgi:hypothetical protein
MKLAEVNVSWSLKVCYDHILIDFLFVGGIIYLALLI